MSEKISELKIRSFGPKGMLYAKIAKTSYIADAVRVFRNGSIMLCTRLKDKNGKDIYKGDIIKHCPLGKEVIQEVDDRIFAILQLDFFDTGQDKVNLLRPIEILGNIYENPELLDV